MNIHIMSIRNPKSGFRSLSKQVMEEIAQEQVSLELNINKDGLVPIHDIDYHRYWKPQYNFIVKYVMPLLNTDISPDKITLKMVDSNLPIMNENLLTIPECYLNYHQLLHSIDLNEIGYDEIFITILSDGAKEFNYSKLYNHIRKTKDKTYAKIGFPIHTKFSSRLFKLAGPELDKLISKSLTYYSNSLYILGPSYKLPVNIILRTHGESYHFARFWFDELIDFVRKISED